MSRHTNRHQLMKQTEKKIVSFTFITHRIYFENDGEVTKAHTHSHQAHQTHAAT